MSAPTQTSAPATSIRPFTVPVTTEAELEALRARVTATRWPDQELVKDHSQGPKLAVMQELARYWAAEYDWRRCEAKLAALPHFITEIDGLDIHFIHVRSDTRTRCRSSSPTGGPARSSSCWRSSTRSPTPPPTAAARRTPSTW